MTCVAGVGTAWDWWPPTRTPLVAPVVSCGGMAMRLLALTWYGPKVPAVWVRGAVPWQPSQVVGPSPTMFMWIDLFTVQAARLAVATVRIPRNQ